MINPIKLATRTRTRTIITAVVGVLVAAGVAAFIVTGTGGDQAGSGDWDTHGADQRADQPGNHSDAAMADAMRYIDENRDSVNSAVRAINEMNKALESQADQVALLMEAQPTVNTAVLEVSVRELERTMEEMVLIVGQTRSQSKEITETATGLAQLQRRIATMEADQDLVTLQLERLSQNQTAIAKLAEGNSELLANPDLFAKPIPELDLSALTTAQALGLCRNSQMLALQPPSVPGAMFAQDNSLIWAAYYENEKVEGRLDEARLKKLLGDCQEDLADNDEAADSDGQTQ